MGKISAKQRDYQFEAFCRDAKYIPQLEAYTINVNGKILRHKDTDKLYEMYQSELKVMGIK